MNQTAHAHTEWISALKAGCQMVNKACLPGGGEEDLRRGRLSALALLMGASNAWLQEQLIQNREDTIQNFIQRRLH